LAIVKKNGIMLVDHAPGPARTGITSMRREAIVRRGRASASAPILMTTLAAMLGALPLLLGEGAGLGAAARPLGITGRGAGCSSLRS